MAFSLSSCAGLNGRTASTISAGRRFQGASLRTGELNKLTTDQLNGVSESVPVDLAVDRDLIPVCSDSIHEDQRT